MAAELNTLLNRLNEYLHVENITDYCPNGLQIQGRSSVQRIVSGVTASQALIDAAIEQQADAILVHHGYFWKGESPCLVGMKYQRIKSLIQNNISLLAYHLPLDMHPEVGNNVQLAKRLDLTIDGTLEADNPKSVGLVGRLKHTMTSTELAQHLEQRLQRAPLVIDGKKNITTVAWCTGAAQGYIEHAIAAGVDAFITGEISEHSTHSAVENNISYFAAGHHATERYGVQALGQWLTKQFAIEHLFIDCPNPV